MPRPRPIRTMTPTPADRSAARMALIVGPDEAAGATVTLRPLRGGGDQRTVPRSAVVEAVRDVQAARADEERARNEAEAYHNDIIPKARGAAEKMIQDSEAYQQEVVAHAQGDAARFDSVYAQYSKAPDVTKKRIYLETMEKMFGGMNKVIVGKNGAVPYFPLPVQQPAIPAAAAEDKK